jgi:hypothetical protein
MDEEEKEELAEIQVVKREPVQHPAIVKAEKSDRMTKYEIENRRKQAYKLRMRGISLPNIAKLLKVSVGTVHRDLAAIAEANREALKGFTPDDFLAEDKAFYDELIELGYQEYLNSKTNTPQRFRALDFLRITRNDRRQAHIDCGLLNENIKIDHKVTYDLPWDEATQKIIAEELVKRSLDTALLEPIPDENIIEAEYTESTNVAESEDVPKEEAHCNNGDKNGS